MRRRRNSRESEATPAPLLLRGRISIPMTALVQTLAVAEYLSFSAHSIVFIGLLPLATAIFGVLRGGERPRPAFWLFSCLGSALVAGFALSQGITGSPTDNLLMLAAIIVCGLGYAEGAKLSRQLGGWQVISWAPVLSLPIMLILTVFTMPPSLASISGAAWASLAYVSLFSMLIGFVFWYRGLAQGGIAAVGQLHLLQPFFGLALAASLLQEKESVILPVLIPSRNRLLNSMAFPILVAIIPKLTFQATFRLMNRRFPCQPQEHHYRPEMLR